MKTRFAPSPTGFLHIGSLRTALFAWLAARSHAGKFYLRIEDTDLSRSNSDYTDLIYDGLSWLGIKWDNETPIVQSERFSIYEEIAKQLVSEDLAYYCHCTRERLAQLKLKQKEKKQTLAYDKCCREKKLPYSQEAVLRLKVPNCIEVQYKDWLHGDFLAKSDLIDDWILMRPGSCPTYNFAVVIDDHALEIDTVIRGDDHLNNTAKQVLLYHLLKYPLPDYCHLPMILDSDGARLSKRQGSANALLYKEKGILPEALMNQLVKLGWSNGDKEVFTQSEMLADFSFAGLQKSPACLDEKKMLWLNKQHINLKTDAELTELVQNFGLFHHLDEQRCIQLVSIFRERVETLKDFEKMSDFLFKPPFIDRNSLVNQFPEYTPEVHRQIRLLISESEDDFSDFFKKLKYLAKEFSLKIPHLALPMRMIVCGTTQAPDFVNIMKFLGKKEILSRFDCIKF
jgi:glutamyl-tRNA synthetase